MKDKKLSTTLWILLMQNNECITYIEWSMARNPMNLDNEIAYKLKQVITKLKLNIIGYKKSI